MHNERLKKFSLGFLILLAGQACQESENVSDEVSCREAVAHLASLQLPTSSAQDENTRLELEKHQKILQRTNRDLELRCEEQKGKEWARCILKAESSKAAHSCGTP